MALLKTLDTPYGPSVKATYHHICEVGWKKAEATVVQLASYASQADRLAPNSVPLGRVNIPLPASAEPPQLPDLYSAIKALPDWSDAQDA